MSNDGDRMLFLW